MDHPTPDAPAFRYRGVKLGLVGVGLALGSAALMNALPIGVLVTAFLVGWVIAAAGFVVHLREVLQEHLARDAQRREWARRHSDPDRRDDPADRRKG